MAIFLKGLFFILFNLLSGFLIVFTIKAILFLPRKAYYFNGKKIIFTPGLLYRKRDWLMNKIRKELKDFLAEAKSDGEEGRISKWEKEAFKKAWEKFEFIEKPRFVPKVIKENLHFFFSAITFEVVKQFLRSFIPYLMEHYQINKYVQLLDKKLNIDIIYGYFNKYLYKYLMWFSLGFFLIVGIGNMIIYYIIQ